MAFDPNDIYGALQQRRQREEEIFARKGFQFVFGATNHFLAAEMLHFMANSTSHEYVTRNPRMIAHLITRGVLETLEVVAPLAGNTVAAEQELRAKAKLAAGGRVLFDAGMIKPWQSSRLTTSGKVEVTAYGRWVDKHIGPGLDALAATRIDILNAMSTDRTR